jgi:spore germination protein KA
MNIFAKNFKAIKQILIYEPPKDPPPFVLKEAERPNDAPSPVTSSLAQHEALLRYAQRLADTVEKSREVLKDPFQTEKIEALKLEIAALEKQKDKLSPVLETYSLEQSPVDQEISTSMEENKLALEKLYNLPLNKDLIIRRLTIPAKPPVNAALAFIDGLSDKNTINLAILQPLMLLGKSNKNLFDADGLEELIAEYLPGNQVKLVHTIGEIVAAINMGDTAILFDGLSQAVLIETKGQEHRGIDRPALEQTVRGSQSAFTETLRINTGLVRALLRTSDLTTEMITVGTRSNTLCAVMYLKSVINPDLVVEAKRRLENITTDAITQAGMLQLLMMDQPILPYPQALSTERPDRVAAALAEGRLAILVDGSPFAIVAPISFFTLLHVSEDFALPWIAGSFSRILRLSGALINILLPAMYLAISYFHQEALPTDLILAIGAAREKVPFPAFVEIAAMEFAFELLREGGIRIPGMLGSTIGIVGAIILGQAAVAASIVSPITVVIIAVTGLASFAVPDYSLSFAFRLTRFIFELLAAILGLIGVAGGLITITVLLCSMKSLGVPYLAPLAPKTKYGYDVILRGPNASQELRPDELSPQDIRRQPKVSLNWTKKPSDQKKGGNS